MLLARNEKSPQASTLVSDTLSNTTRGLANTVVGRWPRTQLQQAAVPPPLRLRPRSRFAGVPRRTTRQAEAQELHERRRRSPRRAPQPAQLRTSPRERDRRPSYHAITLTEEALTAIIQHHRHPREPAQLLAASAALYIFLDSRDSVSRLPEHHRFWLARPWARSSVQSTDSTLLPN